MTITEIEYELNRIDKMPAWGRKQNDDWDKKSNFIYTYPTYEHLMRILADISHSDEFHNYSIHRWYNAMSALGVEKIFTSHNDVQANCNRYDRLVDFTIQGVSFDHKTTVFPKGFGKNIAYARQNPEKLILWLYKEQSTQNRFHLRNRLFLVLFHADGEHWKLRSKLTQIKPIIEDYIQNFDKNKLHQFTFEKNMHTYSDIIWFCK